MGQNLFSVLFSTIKSRFAPIVTKIRLWTSWTFIRTKITSAVRDFFLKVLNIKPKDKDDYYTIFGWMISKRLAYAIIIIIGPPHCLPGLPSITGFGPISILRFC